jgi:hypothetical protein
VERRAIRQQRLGFFDIDAADFPTLGFQGGVGLPNSDFQVLSVTISGADLGNGTFGASDFNQFVFWTPSALNLDDQLIGQPVEGGFTFGEPNGATGDFNIFAAISGAPTGCSNFTLATDSAAGDLLAVTSIAPVVPEPSTGRRDGVPG